MCEPEGSGPAGVEDLPVLPEPLRGAAAGPGRAVGLPGGARGGVREVLPPAGHLHSSNVTRILVAETLASWGQSGAARTSTAPSGSCWSTGGL